MTIVQPFSSANIQCKNISSNIINHTSVFLATKILYSKIGWQDMGTWNGSTELPDYCKKERTKKNIASHKRKCKKRPLDHKTPPRPGPGRPRKISKLLINSEQNGSHGILVILYPYKLQYCLLIDQSYLWNMLLSKIRFLPKSIKKWVCAQFWVPRSITKQSFSIICLKATNR